MAEHVQHVGGERFEEPALLASQMHVRDFADELLGLPPNDHVERIFQSRDNGRVRAALLESSIGDLLLEVTDPLHPGMVGNGGVVPYPLTITEDSRNLRSATVVAVRAKHPWMRYVQPDQLKGLEGNENVLLLPQADGSICAEWEGRVDWQSGIYVTFNWQHGKHEVQETIGIETNENDPGALPLLHSNIGLSFEPGKNFVIWRTRTRPATDELEAAYMLIMAKTLCDPGLLD